jgi:hypothetical protein
MLSYHSPDREDEMKIKPEKRDFFLFIALMLIVGLMLLIGLRWCPAEWVVRRILIGGVGEALIVAALLALTVDKYIKSDLIREASKDVHKYLVGYHLPEEMKERIQEMMCEPIIRRDWRIDYTLTPEKGGEVTVDVRYSFQVENVTNRTVKYLPMIQVEKHLNPTIVELRCDDETSHFRLIAKEGESLGKESDTVPGLIELRYKEIDIKPKGLGQAPYPFSGHYRLRTSPNHGDTFSFGQPSLAVTITMNAPPGYRFSVEPSPWMIQTDNMCQIRRRAFLRSEHVMVRWMKVDDQATNSDKDQT